MSKTVPTILGDKPEASPDQPTPQEVAALLNGLQKNPDHKKAREPSDLEIACAGGLSVVTIPAIIHLRNVDEPFLADDFRSWGWTPFGIFAVGRYENDDEGVEKHILFNGDDVEQIILLHEVYEAAIKEQQAKLEAAESESAEEVDGGTEATESTSN